MPLNKSKGNMYTWVTHTWNAIKGACPHDCSYCYMKRWGKQPELHIDRKELQCNLGEGKFIFVGSSTDMFADVVPGQWIEAVLEHCASFAGNNYLFQSKNPARMQMIGYYFNDLQAVVCTTLETNRHYPDVMYAAPPVASRVSAFRHLPFKRYVTIEPILDFDLEPFVELLRQCEPDQVNIGADSGNNGLPEPTKDKILALVDELRKFTVVDQKRNLHRLGL